MEITLTIAISSKRARAHITSVRIFTTIAAIPIAVIVETTTGALTVAIFICRTRTRITTFRTIAAISVVKLALRVEATPVAPTVTTKSSRTIAPLVHQGAS